MIADKLTDIGTQIEAVMLVESRARGYDQRFQLLLAQMSKIHESIAAAAREAAAMESAAMPRSARWPITVVTKEGSHA